MDKKEFFGITVEMQDYFRSMFINDDESIESLIIDIKGKGYTQMQTFILLMEIGGFNFQEANLKILNSKAWQ